MAISIRRRVILLGSDPNFWDACPINHREVDLFPMEDIEKASALLAACVHAEYFSLVIVDAITNLDIVLALTPQMVDGWLGAVPNVLVFVRPQDEKHQAILNLKAAFPERFRVSPLGETLKQHEREIVMAATAQLSGVRTVRVLVGGMNGVVTQFRVIRTFDGGVPSKTHTFYMGMVVDVGVSGALLTSNVALHPGTVIGFTITSAFFGGLLVRGTVVRAEAKTEPGGTVHYHGIKFVDTPDAPAMSAEVAAALEMICKAR